MMGKELPGEATVFPKSVFSIYQIFPSMFFLPCNHLPVEQLKRDFFFYPWTLLAFHSTTKVKAHLPYPPESQLSLPQDRQDLAVCCLSSICNKKKRERENSANLRQRGRQASCGMDWRKVVPYCSHVRWKNRNTGSSGAKAQVLK